MKLFPQHQDIASIASIAILIILYSVGTYAFLTNWESVINLTPINLMISLCIMLYASIKSFDLNFILFCVIAYLAGFGVELLGTQTGFPFGIYSYHHVLGFKLWDTPLLIGANWLILLLATRAVIDRWLLVNKWVGAVLGAFLMVLIDIFIEPVAVKFYFWTWADQIIPLSNYISWWVIAFFLHLLQRILIPHYDNKVAFAIFFIQIIFFGVLNIFM